MSDRESLRPVIAEILDGLVSALPWTEGDRQDRLWTGARTLRWTHAYEETIDTEERTELERLRELVGEIESALDETKRDPRGYVKPMHPGTFRKKVAELLEADQ